MEEEILTDLYLKKLNKGWECILDQYFNFACEQSMKEGKGISMFRFLKKTEGCNCHYFYIKSENTTWNSIISSSPNSSLILEKYDPDSMVLLCVQVPSSTTLLDEESSGTIRLFYIDTKKEVSLEEENKKEVIIESSLRKRVINDVLI